jgi:CRISPR system Cascade subunit CasE
MYFSRVLVDTEGLDTEKLAAFLKGNYFLHQLLWKLFPGDPDAKRDFLYRHDAERDQNRFYVVSKRSPQAVPGLFRVASKPYSPCLKSGDRLGFSLRVNPVITLQGSRHDVVMNAKRGLKQEGQEFFPPDVVTEAGLGWLEPRAQKAGFCFDPARVRVEGYLQHRFVKPGNAKPIRLSTLDFDGLLTVTEPERFLSILYEGMGPAKSFGCGLMLIRRI